jgi:DNA modification methylase
MARVKQDAQTANVAEQVITDRYALYNGDCVETLRSLPAESVGLSLYSPPFQSGKGNSGGLYVYSSDPRDISNSIDAKEFWQHLDFVVSEIHRVTMPGRMTAVHCSDIATGNTGLDSLYDLPGDLIRQHERLGFAFTHRYFVFKNALTVRNRTMTKALAHKTLCRDSSRCSMANADQLLIFRRSGENKVPIAHPTGLTEYAGSEQMPTEILRYRNWQGSQLENRFSHWIWQRYAGAFWDDIRIDRVLPYKESKDEESERHCHPLQQDVIDRALVLWSNPGDVVLSPFMGVGSEIYAAVRNGRRGLGIELKRSFYLQACKNVEAAAAQSSAIESNQETMFGSDILNGAADIGRETMDDDDDFLEVGGA